MSKITKLDLTSGLQTEINNKITSNTELNGSARIITASGYLGVGPQNTGLNHLV